MYFNHSSDVTVFLQFIVIKSQRRKQTRALHRISIPHDRDSHWAKPWFRYHHELRSSIDPRNGHRLDKFVIQSRSFCSLPNHRRTNHCRSNGNNFFNKYIYKETDYLQKKTCIAVNNYTWR